MKIEGMDAHNISYPKLADHENSHKIDKIENINDRHKDEKIENKNTNDIYNGKDINQLSDQEKKNLPTADKVLIEAIEKANKAINGGSRRFEFSIHEKTKEIMVKVINSDTNEVIREIPSEKTLDMVAKLWEMSGLMVDERR